jgi:hypothetical protein
VLHSITSGMAHRGLALGGAYVSVAVLGWPILGVALLGIVDTIFGVRARAAGGPPTNLTPQ